MQSANPFYELVGGYYPGKPMPRRKKSPGKPVQPAEFGSGDVILNEYIKSIEKDLSNANVPKKIKNLFIDDVVRQLQAKAGPQQKTYNVDRALELGDSEELAGVQLELNLNPFDWLSDPKGTLEKLAKDTVTSFINPTDMIIHDEQVEIWNKLLKGEEPSRTVKHLIEPTLEDTSIRGEATTPFKLMGLGVYTEKKDPVIVGPKEEKDGTEVIGGKKAYVDKTPEGDEVPVTTSVDLFESTALKYKDFSRSARSSGARDSKFREFVNQAAIASASELQSLKIANKLDPASIKAVDNFIDEAKILRLANGVTGRTDFAKYVYADGTEWGGIGMGPEMLSGELSKLILGTSRDKTDKDGNTVINQRFENLKNVGERIRGGLTLDENKNVVSATGLVGVKWNLKELRNNYVERNGANSEARFDRITKDLNQYLDKMLGEEGDGSSGIFKDLDNALAGIKYKETKNDDGTVTRMFELPKNFSEKELIETAKNLKGAISHNIITFKAEGAIKSGLDKLSTNFIHETLNNEELVQAVNNNAEIIGTRNTLNLAAMGLSTYRTEDITDLINKLEKDGGASSIVVDYLWNRARARIESYTPAQYVKQYLEEHHYFGLVYNPQYAEESALKGELYDRGSRTVNYIMDKSPLKSLFVNKQRLKVVGLKGEVAFDFVGDLNLKIGLDLFSKTLLKTRPMSMENLIDVINLNKSAFGKNAAEVIVGFEDYSYVHGFDRGWEDLVLRSEGFRNWVKMYGEKTLGIKFSENNLIENTPENRQLLGNLLTELRKRDGDQNYNSIFSSKTGLLQKVSSKLNLLQQRVFGSRLGKLLKFAYAPGSYLKNEIKKKVLRGLTKKVVAGLTKAILKVLGFIATDLTGGLALVVWGAVEFAVQWVVNKVLTAGEKIVKAIKEADLTIVSDFVDTTFSWVIKTASIATLLITLMLVPTTATMGVIMASITPVDSTRSSFISDVASTPGGLPGGPASLCNVGRGGGKGKDCFNMTGSWPTQQRDVIQYALNYLVNNFGSFTNKLCAAGDISVDWDPGYADCGRVRSANEIAFGGNHCYLYDVNNENSVNQFIWLVTHELAHAYDLQLDGKLYDWGGNKNVDIEVSFAEAQENDCGQTTLKTYRGGSGTQCSTQSPAYEDWAETIANYVAIHRDCDANIPGCDTFWTDRWTSTGCSYTNRLEWLENNIFN